MVFRIKSIFGASSSDTNQVTEKTLLGETNISASEKMTNTDKDEQINAETTIVSESSAVSEVPAEKITHGVKEPNQEETLEKKNYIPKKKARNHDELLLEVVPERSKFASENLKSVLQGTIIFEVLPSNKKYALQFNSNSECEIIEPSSIEKADCNISIHGRDLMRIYEGDLNPQVLMLSHKVKVSGNTKLATYIYNLIAPLNF
jgi:hypothetical protein